MYIIFRTEYMRNRLEMHLFGRSISNAHFPDKHEEFCTHREAQNTGFISLENYFFIATLLIRFMFQFAYLYVYPHPSEFLKNDNA